MAAPQTKYKRNPDGSISEVKEPQSANPALNNIIPAYLVAQAAQNGGAGAVAAGQAGSMAGQAVGSGINGGTLIADGFGGSEVAGMGAGGYALPALGAAAFLSNIYEGGAKDIIKGKGKGEDYANLALDVNPVTAPINMVGRALGFKSVGRSLFGGSATKGEENARKKLAEQGVTVDNADVKEWELNEKFKQSRNEADLTGKDIINAAQLYQLDGYATATPEKRQAIADEAIKQQLVQEKLGQINVGSNAGFEEFVKNQLAAPAASTNTGGGDNRRIQAEAKKERKRAQVDQVLSMNAQPTEAPRYDMNLSNIYKNPYL